MLVGELDEAVRDVSSPVETHYLGLHVAAGRLEQRGREGNKTKIGANSPSLSAPHPIPDNHQHHHKPCDFPGDLAPPSCCDKPNGAAVRLFDHMTDRLTS